MNIEQKYKIVRGALVAIVGTDDKEILNNFLLLADRFPQQDRATAIAGINALLVTQETTDAGSPNEQD